MAEKLNESENYFIKQCVIHAIKRAESETDALIANGSQPIFVKGYFETLSSKLFDKIDKLTLVTKKESNSDL
jgi:hypothetical protein